MNDDETSVSLPLPLDEDGFLRRECPTCEREFKWLASTDDEAADAASAPDGGYYCPYCGVQAEPNSWFTNAQIELAQNLVAREVIDPMIKELGRDFRNVGRRSGGFIQTDLKYEPPAEQDPLTEVNDMSRIDFGCHPGEPVKVLESWKETVYCLVCGAAAS